jgi:hypothetical protein
MTGIFGILESPATQWYRDVPTQEFFFFIVLSIVYGESWDFTRGANNRCRRRYVFNIVYGCQGIQIYRFLNRTKSSSSIRSFFFMLTDVSRVQFGSVREEKKFSRQICGTHDIFFRRRRSLVQIVSIGTTFALTLIIRRQSKRASWQRARPDRKKGCRRMLESLICTAVLVCSATLRIELWLRRWGYRYRLPY